MKILITQHPFSSLNSKEANELNRLGVSIDSNPFRAIPSEEQLISIIDQYDFILSGSAKLSKDVLQHAKNLKLISRAGTGIDNVDLNYIKENKIKLTYTPDAPSESVAEYTLASIIGLSRNIFNSINLMKKNSWSKSNGRNINSMVLGIIGLNRIGKELVKILAPFNMTILAADIKPDNDFAKLHNIKFCNQKELLQNSDIVSLHLPLNQNTQNLIDMKSFELMKSSASIINTSRGGIVNELDLYKALKDKTISSAVLDVFENEPYNGKLISLDNCICTPHMAGASKESASLMETTALQEIINYIKGEELKNPFPLS